MNFIPAYLYAWHRHIRYMLERTATPSISETNQMAEIMAIKMGTEN